MQISNSIAWAHLQLKGGWRNVLTTTAAYLMIVVVLIFASLRMAAPSPPAPVLGGWLMILMGLQIGTLVLFGCWAISTAIRKDVTNKIIESHRLMPVSGTDAVAGYIIGPASQAIAMSCVNVVLGLVLCRWAAFGSPVGWLKANFVLGVFAACAWVVVAFLPLALPVGSRVLMGLIWIVFIGHQSIPSLLPGFSVLFGPGLNESVFGVIATGQITAGQKISMFAQVLVAVLCYAGAARKYRRDDVLAWGPIMGLAVAAAFVVIQLTGLTLWEVVSPRMWHVSRIPFETQLLIAALGAMLVGIIPVWSASWLHTLWQRRRSLHDPAPNRRPLPVVLVVLVAAVIVAALPPLAVQARWEVASNAPVVAGQPVLVPQPVMGPSVPVDLVVRTGLIVLAFLLSVSYLLRWLCRREIRVRWWVVLFVLLTWTMPPLVDFIIKGVVTGFESEEVLTSRSACSPLVAMISIWAAGPLSTSMGIAVQWLIAGVMAAVYHLGGRSAAKFPAPAGTARATL